MISVRDLIGDAASFRYDDNGDPLLRPRERILLALRWRDWIEPMDLLDDLNVETESKERFAYTRELSRLVASGRVERRIETYLDNNGIERGFATVRLAPRQPKVTKAGYVARA